MTYESVEYRTVVGLISPDEHHFRAQPEFYDREADAAPKDIDRQIRDAKIELMVRAKGANSESSRRYQSSDRSTTPLLELGGWLLLGAVGAFVYNLGRKMEELNSNLEDLCDYDPYR